MNRRQRRAGSRAQQLARTIACPDCDSDVTVVKATARVYSGEVRHDDTCPWYADFERAGGFGIRFGRTEQDMPSPSTPHPLKGNK